MAEEKEIILPIREEAACGAAPVDENFLRKAENERAEKRKREIWRNLRVDETKIRVAARRDRNEKWMEYYRSERKRYKDAERQARLCVQDMVAEAGCPFFQD